MNKTQKILFSVFIGIVLLLTILEAIEPEPVNWNASYSEIDKIPLGSFVLFQSLKKLENANISKINRPPYEQLIQQEFNGTYFFLNEFVAFDDAELDEMLQWVEKGNTLFVSAKYLSGNLTDTLNLETSNSYSTQTIDSRPLFELANPSLKAAEPFLFDHDTDIMVFNKIDTVETKVLGFAKPFIKESASKERKPNFVAHDFGEGKIYLHLAPEAFSNYFLLSENNIAYTKAALSYLDISEAIYWDSYYKAGKTFYSSPLYVLFKSKKLKWAYYFVLLGCVLFIIFEGKRKQRSIKIVEPLTNQTYNYTRTIAGLYLERRQYRKIALKKIKLFMEHVRTQLRISTIKLDSSFYENVASRSGKSIEETKELFQYIAQIESRKDITKADLLKLSKKINTFKK